MGNSGGAIQSTAAALAVTDTNPIPVLTALPPTNASHVPFILKGEPGRSYVFDATDDFVHWNTCIYCFGWPGHAGSVSNSFTVPRINLQRQFIKAWLDTNLDTCVAQVYAMRAALALYNIENKLMPADWGYTVENLAPYLPGATIPSCPQDGIYWPGAAVSNIVTCSWSYRGHDLPWDLRSFQ